MFPNNVNVGVMLFSAISGSNQTWLGLASLMSEGNVLQLDTCLHLTRVLVFPKNVRMGLPSFFGAISGTSQMWLGLAWLGFGSE